MEYERIHHLQRVRNNDGGDHHINRPRKVGIGWQQLRASASILIDWILAAERRGWLGAPSRNKRDVIVRDAAENVRRLHRMREDRGLHLTGVRYPGHDRPHQRRHRRRTAELDPPDSPARAQHAPELTDEL